MMQIQMTSTLRRNQPSAWRRLVDWLCPPIEEAPAGEQHDYWSHVVGPNTQLLDMYWYRM